MNQIPRIAASVLTVVALTIGVAFALRPNPPGSGIVVQATNGAQTPTACTANQVLAWNGSGTLTCFQQPAAAFQVGLAASRPVATGSGKSYQCTDIPVVYHDTGIGVWTGVLSKFLAPPAAASSYTSVGNLALYQEADAIRAVNTLQNGNPGVGLVAGTLSQTGIWQVSLHFLPLQNIGAQFPEIALVVSTGTTGGSSTTYNIGLYSSPSPGIHTTQDVLATTTRNTTYNEISQSLAFIGSAGGGYFRILNDSSTMHFQSSQDGQLYQTVFGISSPSGLTNYGFWIGNENNNASNGWMQAIILEQSLQNPTGDAVTGSTGNGVTPMVINIANTSRYTVGDQVGIHGMTGNTGCNTGTGGGIQGTGKTVTAVVANTSIAIAECTGTGTWVSGGTVVNLSRNQFTN